LGDVGGGGWTNRWVCRKYKKENNNTINQHLSLFHPITSLQPPENSINRKIHHPFHPPFPLPIPFSSFPLPCNPVKPVHLATRKREREVRGWSFWWGEFSWLRAREDIRRVRVEKWRKQRGGGSKSADIEKEKDSSAGHTKAQTRARI